MPLYAFDWPDWHLLPHEDAAWLAQIRFDGRPLEHLVAKIHQGLNTGSDDIFLMREMGRTFKQIVFAESRVDLSIGSRSDASNCPRPAYQGLSKSRVAESVRFSIRFVRPCASRRGTARTFPFRIPIPDALPTKPQSPTGKTQHALVYIVGCRRGSSSGWPSTRQ